MNNIFTITAILLLCLLVLTAAQAKPGPMVTLTLVNKTLNQSAFISLNGLTNFSTYYLTAKGYPIPVKYPAAWWRGGSPMFGNDVVYEVRADIYEAGVYACGNPAAQGILNLTHNVRLVFPLCEKARARKSGNASGVGGVSQGEPTQEKISTSRMFPGYWDAEHACIYAGGLNNPDYFGNIRWNDRGNSVDGGGFSMATPDFSGCVIDVYNDNYVGDGYSDGTLEGAYYAALNGAQVRWMLDFQNWDNGGVDIWH
jgi:hypothetical protein